MKLSSLLLCTFVLAVLAQESHLRAKRQAVFYFTPIRKWTNNTVYYFFDRSPEFNPSYMIQNFFHATVQYIENRTCVRFVESTTASNRVQIYLGGGGFLTAPIGMFPGVSSISTENIGTIGRVGRELGHILGLVSTQSRPDRDDYITVDHTPSGYCFGAFTKLAPSHINITTPYEYGSMMHGSANFLTSDNQFTLYAKNPDYQRTMGNKEITFYDIMLINDFYGCSDKCKQNSNAAQCENGGVPNPNNCRVCICPNGYSGTLCKIRPADGCGKKLLATTTPKTLEVKMGPVALTESYKYCYYWIEAPEGYSIEVKIVSIAAYFTDYGCTFNAIEVKGDANPRITNPRFCSSDAAGKVIKSALNPTPVIFAQREGESTFKIEYSAVLKSV